jgi:hypothetical protein
MVLDGVSLDDRVVRNLATIVNRRQEKLERALSSVPRSSP